MKTQRKLKSWKYKNDWPIIREVRRKDGIKFKVDTTTKLGKRHQPVRDTKAEAELLCEQYRLKLRNNGVQSFRLSTSETEDASKALNTVRGMGFTSLTEAISMLQEYYCPARGDITVKEFREEFLSHHNGMMQDDVKSERTYRDLKSRTRLIEETMGDRLLKELSPDLVWDTLQQLKRKRSWSRQNLKNYVRVWKQFFNFAVKKEYRSSNPLDQPRIKFEIEEATKAGRKSAPKVLSADQAGAMLEAAYELEELNMLPIVSVMLFAGLRPESEALKLTWDDFDWERNYVSIGGDRSKTGKPRRVALRPVLLRWLQMCNKSVPFKPINWQKRWKQIREKSGITEWCEDYCRHSFASYSWADHGDDRQLEAELGHVQPETKDYYLQVSPAVNRDYERFWNLNPEIVLNPDEEEESLLCQAIA